MGIPFQSSRAGIGANSTRILAGAAEVNLLRKELYVRHI
jgi:hypothetical protein